MATTSFSQSNASVVHANIMSVHNLDRVLCAYAETSFSQQEFSVMFTSKLGPELANKVDLTRVSPYGWILIDTNIHSFLLLTCAQA